MRVGAISPEPTTRKGRRPALRVLPRRVPHSFPSPWGMVGLMPDRSSEIINAEDGRKRAPSFPPVEYKLGRPIKLKNDAVPTAFQLCAPGPCGIEEMPWHLTGDRKAAPKFYCAHRRAGNRWLIDGCVLRARTESLVWASCAVFCFLVRSRRAGRPPPAY